MTTVAGRDSSLDVLRGLTIMVMILTYAGNEDHHPKVLLQTYGCGWSVGDLVVPFFLWTIGLSLTRSVGKRRAAGEGVARLMAHVAVRGVALYLVGVILGAMPCINTMALMECVRAPRLLGIFERIAIAYLLAAPLVLLLTRRQLTIVLAVALLGYQLVYVGLDADVMCDVDVRRDLATSIPAACYIIAGVVTSGYGSLHPRALGAVGAALVVGAVMLQFVLPLAYQPLNLSFFALSTGIAMIVLGVVTFVRRYEWLVKLSGPAVSLGRNPLVLYLFSAVVFELGHSVGTVGGSGEWTSFWTQGWLFLSRISGSRAAGSLAMALLLLLLTYALAWLLSRRQIIVKL